MEVGEEDVAEGHALGGFEELLDTYFFKYEGVWIV